MTEDYKRQKTIVVGAGPVGALAALYAAQRGHEVEVYELRSGTFCSYFLLLSASLLDFVNFRKSEVVNCLHMHLTEQILFCFSQWRFALADQKSNDHATQRSLNPCFRSFLINLSYWNDGRENSWLFHLHSFVLVLSLIRFHHDIFRVVQILLQS
jgi:hypothetical protein